MEDVSNMFKSFSLTTAALLVPTLVLSAVVSFAGKASAQEVVTCESNNGGRNICRVDTGGRARLIEQLSNSSCNGNWGYSRDAIWVRRGCRARFVVGSDRGRYDRNDRNDRYNRNDRYYRNGRYNRDDRYNSDDRYNRNDQYDWNRDRR